MKKFIYTNDNVVKEIMREIQVKSLKYANNRIIQSNVMYFSFAMVNGEIRLIKLNKSLCNIIAKAHIEGTVIFERKLKIIISGLSFYDYSKSYFMPDIECITYNYVNSYITMLDDLQLPDRILKHFEYKIEKSNSIIIDVVETYAPNEREKIIKYIRTEKLKKLFE